MNSVDILKITSINKVKLLKDDPFKYFCKATLAGIFVSLAGFVSIIMMSYMGDYPLAKLIQAILFSSALIFVIMIGGELFTGNNLTMIIGRKNKSITTKDLIYIWIVCWIGNLYGSLIATWLFCGSGCDKIVSDLIISSAMIKINYTYLEMINRGILCNFCVCLAVLSGTKTKNDVAKIIMIIFCICIFIICGFEHVVANMSTFCIVFLYNQGILLGIIKNLFFVTAGNILGGLLLSVFV